MPSSFSVTNTPVSNTFPEKGYSETLKSKWLTVTLFVVGVLLLLIGGYSLTKVARVVTLTCGGYLVALTILGFVCESKEKQKIETTDFQTASIDEPIPSPASPARSESAKVEETAPVIDEKKRELYTDINEFWNHIVEEEKWSKEYDIFAAIIKNPEWLKERTTRGETTLHLLMSTLRWDKPSEEYGGTAFREALVQHADFNATMLGDITPLHLAAEKGRSGVRFLLGFSNNGHGLRAHVNAKTLNGQTPLHYAYIALEKAIKQKDEELIQSCIFNVKLLLTEDADETLQDTTPELCLPEAYLDVSYRKTLKEEIQTSPLHEHYFNIHEFWMQRFTTNFRDLKYNVFEALIANPRWLRVRRPESQETPLHLLMMSSFWDIPIDTTFKTPAFDAVVKKYADFNARNILKQTPLHFAVRFSSGAVAYLLSFIGAGEGESARVDINAEDDDLNTPLHLAYDTFAKTVSEERSVDMQNSAKKTIQMLLTAGADPAKKNKQSKLPIECLGMEREKLEKMLATPAS